MEVEMEVKFPAMRGKMGKRNYFITTMQMSAVPRMFSFDDWAGLAPEDREQRILNTKRVPEIAHYILDNEDGYIFSSITASYKADVNFTPINDEETLGYVVMDIADANFIINDGQHRAAAINAALKDNPDIGRDTISVLLFPYEQKERVQQMFSDLNRFVQKTSKSLDILYDKRDRLSKVTLEAIEQIPVFKDMVDKDAVSLPVRSPKLFTLAALYDANKELLKAFDKEDEQALVARAVEYWNSVAAAMPDWRKVQSGLVPSIQLRQERIASHSTVLRAIGAAGSDLLQLTPEDWQDRVRGLEAIDWSKKNREWENVCIIANSVVSNRQARLATKAYIKRKLGLVLSEAELRSLDGDPVLPGVSSVA
jgi:DNA sulfur modification protein DndB